MEKKIVNNYGSFDVTFVKSKGSTMWDANGKSTSILLPELE